MITSRPNDRQALWALRHALRRRAWDLIDAVIDLATAGTTETAVDVTEDPDEKAWVTCVLHVGFVCIPETDEQLRRLRSESMTRGSPSRPAIARMLPIYHVAPINRVAMRVAGWNSPIRGEAWQQASQDRPAGGGE